MAFSSKASKVILDLGATVKCIVGGGTWERSGKSGNEIKEASAEKRSQGRDRSRSRSRVWFIAAGLIVCVFCAFFLWFWPGLKQTRHNPNLICAKSLRASSQSYFNDKCQKTSSCRSSIRLEIYYTRQWQFLFPFLRQDRWGGDWETGRETKGKQKTQKSKHKNPNKNTKIKNTKIQNTKYKHANVRMSWTKVEPGRVEWINGIYTRTSSICVCFCVVVYVMN